jgi:hypothetical protein
MLKEIGEEEKNRGPFLEGHSLVLMHFRPKTSYGMGLSVCPSRLYSSVYKTICPKEIKKASRNAGTLRRLL